MPRTHIHTKDTEIEGNHSIIKILRRRCLLSSVVCPETCAPGGPSFAELYTATEIVYLVYGLSPDRIYDTDLFWPGGAFAMETLPLASRIL